MKRAALFPSSRERRVLPPPMLIAVEDHAESTTLGSGTTRDGLELRWLTRVDGAPAAHHTLRAATEAAGAFFEGMSLPCWSATIAPWASGLHWYWEVRPRVIRDADAFADRLGVTNSAAALVIVERGYGAAGESVEHEIIVLARFARRALQG